MNLETFKNEFDVKFYKFSLKEFEEEIGREFQLLKTIQNVHVMKFIDMTGDLSLEEKKIFAKAFLKNRHRNAVRRCEDILTGEEAEYLKNYLKIGFISKYSEKIYYRNLSLKQNDPEHAKSVDRKNFFQRVLEAIVPIVGEVEEKAGNTVAFLEKKFGEWKVCTSIDVGGRMKNLSYDQYIRGDNNLKLLDGGSILSRLGLASTDWNELLELDTDIAICTLVVACRRFMDAIPGLLTS